MIAIRGAITVNEDCVEQIKEAVNQMLSEIVSKNGLKQDDIICIMLSNTADIKSYYPAKAAREIGFSNCALYSSLEPEIDGSLKLCIRVMLLVEKQIKPVHVYLKGAKSLRKDITSKLNIALDGPAGSGKSTVAKILAKDFDILYLDIGWFPFIPLDHEIILLFISLEEPVIINFSFGLVNATYKTLISSDKFSISILFFKASLAILG